MVLDVRVIRFGNVVFSLILVISCVKISEGKFQVIVVVSENKLNSVIELIKMCL